MEMPETAPQENAQMPLPETESHSALERLAYLCPSRYFHCYLFFDRVERRTCWLPEGYIQ